MELHHSNEITVHELYKLQEMYKNDIQILDIREDSEREHASIKGTIHIKISNIPSRYEEISKDKNVFVMCHTGTRSQSVVKWLKVKGYDNAVNVLGGIDAWAALIDRSIRRY